MAVAYALDADGEGHTALTVAMEDPDGTFVELDGSESWDPDDDELTYHWSVEASSGVILDPHQATTGGIFGVGVHIVTLTVEDGKGGYDTADVIVTVVEPDAPPPVVEVTTDVASIWPPHHRMVPVTIIAHATQDAVGPGELFVMGWVSSSQPDDSDGDGAFIGDVDGEDGFTEPVPVALEHVGGGEYHATIFLRAERDGDDKRGRVYSIVVEALDAANNMGSATCTVVVPHNQGQGNQGQGNQGKGGAK